MNAEKYNIKLNMKDTGILKTGIKLKQGDSNIVFLFTIMSGNFNVFNSSEIPEVVFRRPDGTSIIGEASCTSSQYIYTFKGNELQLAGKMYCDVKFGMESARLSTMTFEFECTADTLSDTFNGSGPYVEEFKNRISNVETELDDQSARIKVLENAQGTLASNVSGLTRMVTTQGNTIGYLQKDVNTNKNNIQENADAISALAGSTQIVNSASGHFITLNDSSDGRPISLTLYGKALQSGTSGKQLYDVNAEKISTTPYTIDADGFVTITLDNSANTSSGFGNFHTVPSTDLLPSTEYKFVVEVASISNCNFIPVSQYTGIPSQFEGSKTLSTTGVHEFSMNTVSDFSNAQTMLRTYIVVDAGKVGTCKFRIMVMKASETDKTYELYTGGIASPNPDYPQEVTVAGANGDIVLTSCGKNILNIDNTSAECIESISNDAIAFKGALSAAWYRLGVAKLVKGQAYTITGSIGYGRIGFGNSDTTIPSGAVMSDYTSLAGNTVNVLNSNRTKISFVANKTFTAYVWYCTDTGNTGSNPSFTTTLQIEAGSESTDYTRHYGTTATISITNGFAGIPVESGGNYVDENGQQWMCDTIEFTASTGNGTIDSGYYVQRIKKLRLTSADAWKMATTNENNWFFLADVQDFAQIGTVNHYNTCGNAYCTHAVFRDNADELAKGNYYGFGLYYNTASNYYRVSFSVENIQTLDGVKAFLDANEVYIYYPLAEPIETDLTDEQISAFNKIHIFHSTTNLFTDDIGNVGMKYPADTKLYIDNKFNELATAILSAVGSEG